MANAERWLHAVFATPAEARDALTRLVEAGVTAADIEVRSSVPLHDVVRPLDLGLQTRVHHMAILGGVMGGVVAYLLTSLSSLAYPLPTGGMPLVPIPPSAVITFEGVAIGAILCTVATVFYECRLPRFGKPAGPLDAHLAAGSIIVAVRATEGESWEWAANAVVTEVHGGGEGS